MTAPPKLRPGDGVRVVAPSRSLRMIDRTTQAIARERLEGRGLRVSFGAHVRESDAFVSTTVAHRVADLHDAFEDPSVALVQTVIGGFNVNQLLRALDYRRLARNPKALIGYSDITALQLAVLARTGLTTFSGPHFSTLGMRKGCGYTLEHFQGALFHGGARELAPSPSWSDDPWYRDQDHRRFHRNPGPWVVHPGTARGRVVGGNLCTMNLLHGTDLLPDLKGAILFVEDTDLDATPVYFDRNLQSLLHLPAARDLAGVVIGRFPPAAKMSRPLLRAIVDGKPELQGVPVVAGLDFGHTSPMFTFPIGGRGELVARRGAVRLTVRAG